MLGHRITEMSASAAFIAFMNHRRVWIGRGRDTPVPLDVLADVPTGFDWYTAIHAEGSRLLVGVANYSEEQRRQDRAQPTGGFVRGSTPVGLLSVDVETKEVDYYTWFIERGRGAGEAVQTQVPDIQSILIAGDQLLIAGAGHLSLLDLHGRGIASLDDGGDGISFTRDDLWLRGEEIWYVADEGGLLGNWVGRFHTRGAEEFRPLNYSYTNPNSGLAIGDSVLISSSAGVIEIDAEAARYTHYRIDPDPKKMAVYGLALLDGELWGALDDGWVRFSLPDLTAERFSLRGEGGSNYVEAVASFGGAFYVATDEQVVVLEPGARESDQDSEGEDGGR